VWLGSAAGLPALPDWTAEGDQNGALFGRPARTAGDVNGDGAADLVVGASHYDGGQIDEGAVSVYHGAPGATLHLFRIKLGWKPGARPGTYRAGSAVAVHDQYHAPGVTVSGTWTDPNGTVTGQTAVTNAKGQAKFALKGWLAGAYQFCVTGLAKAGHADDPAGDHVARCKAVQVGP
jgi:hypothetical protein